MLVSIMLLGAVAAGLYGYPAMSRAAERRAEREAAKNVRYIGLGGWTENDSRRHIPHMVKHILKGRQWITSIDDFVLAARLVVAVQKEKREGYISNMYNPELKNLDREATGLAERIWAAERRSKW